MRSWPFLKDWSETLLGDEFSAFFSISSDGEKSHREFKRSENADQAQLKKERRTQR